MTYKIDNILIIEEQDPEKCEMCGKEAELRPYGPNGENACFECCMQDEEAAKKQFEKRLKA